MDGQAELPVRALWPRGPLEVIVHSRELHPTQHHCHWSRRKRRRGVLEDSYQARPVDTEGYLARYMAYIDLNMVHAGAVDRPRQWRESGYREVRGGRQRYRIIDRCALSDLLGVAERNLAAVQAEWVESALAASE